MCFLIKCIQFENLTVDAENVRKNEFDFNMLFSYSRERIVTESLISSASFSNSVLLALPTQIIN